MSHTPNSSAVLGNLPNPVSPHVPEYKTLQSRNVSLMDWNSILERMANIENAYRSLGKDGFAKAIHDDVSALGALYDTLASMIAPMSARVDGLSSALDTESATRAAADSALTDRIAAEEGNRLASDAELQSLIDALQTALDNETSTRGSADTELGARIDGLASDLSAERTTRSNKDEEHDSEIASKSTVRINGAFVSEFNADTKADLDEHGKVPAAQLPSYVDDVLEYPTLQNFPETGESGKIYVALDTNRTYRWGGSSYVEVSESLALGETSSTAYAGDKGAANAAAIAQIPSLYVAKSDVNVSIPNDPSDEKVPSTKLLKTSVEGEANSRSAADNALGARIDSETSARTAADNALGTRISSEESARVLADNALGTRIDNEESARSSADTALGTRIDNEESSRAAADTALGVRIDAEESARANAVNAEASARALADTALGARIDGKADLVQGKVPASQLPAYVDDVLEYATTQSFPVNGEPGKIYVSLDNNKTYRWGGSEYVEISQSLALGTTSSTAYRGDLGAQAAAAIAALQSGLSSEESSRQSADTALGGRIDSEASTRASADTALGARIDGKLDTQTASSGLFVYGFSQVQQALRLSNADTASTVAFRDAYGRTKFADPLDGSDAATKQYVDNRIRPTWKSLEINSWSALTGAYPYAYQATIQVPYTLTNNSVVELVNNNAVLFATYGFAIGAVSSVTGNDNLTAITVYAINQPATTVTLEVSFVEP